MLNRHGTLLTALAGMTTAALWLAPAAVAADPWDEGPHTEPGPRGLTPAVPGSGIASFGTGVLR